MRGLRNRIVHNYDDVDYDIIWNVLKNEIPTLRPLHKYRKFVLTAFSEIFDFERNVPMRVLNCALVSP